jgi:uncharacterized protein YjbJ (UPF0337 family)
MPCARLFNAVASVHVPASSSAIGAKFLEPCAELRLPPFTLAVLDSELLWRRQKRIGTGSRGTGRLVTDDDLAQINGRRDQLKEGSSNATVWLKILAKDLARKDVDDWLDAQP